MSSDLLPWDQIDPILDQAISEDVGQEDITTESLIPKDVIIEAEWVAKEPCRVAGLPIVDRIFQRIDSEIRTFWGMRDGEEIRPGKFGLIKGFAHGILKGERTALNFLQRLSGIATKTAAFAAKVQKYEVKIYDTRKTTPTLRILEKYAVRLGSGHNHRFGLDDMVLIKENHRLVLEELKIDDWSSRIHKIRQDHPKVLIGIEVTRTHEVQEAIKMGADFILLDNMAPDQVEDIAKQWKGKVLLEVSGGVRLENVEAYARTGVDRISIGSLTHSIQAIDMSLEVLGVR